ncbi:MAG: phosphoglycerate kinase [Ignavibacteriales bacterium]|nr:phosphoglycerate kinase [Ignavibacteriales bacterium]MCF8304951.1 phosphoglycerate kinase [Ignavibacteriales bacterium]MCF8314640.1 phosphoglycerate kinase [Ignavibacteriales bacterium]MCF8436323.1 phosphoglycerate kinase [Ignavibacteriales bacterium]
MNKLSIDNLDFKGKRTLVRVDFNVPLNESLQITDDKRIVASLPTIKKLISVGARVILMSHLGRPKGKPDPSFSLKPAAAKLAEHIGKNVIMAPDCVGDEVEKLAASMKDGDVMLLENLRYHKEEEGNDPEFSKLLSKLGELYVNDAFGSAHRAHASTEGVTKYMQKCASGYLMQKELDYLGKAILEPKRPLLAILGGAKISGKIDVIENMLPKVDALIIGGGMAFTFFKAQGYEIGSSLLEEDKVELAGQLLKRAAESGKKILLPVDVLAATEFKDDSPAIVCDSDKIPADRMGLDIGPKTTALFSDEILNSKTVIWNGPMGVFEFPNFAKGTFAIAKKLAEATEKGAITVIGGGDSASAVKKAGVAKAVTHVSTGGGASLEFLEGKILPGVAALNDN